jgi:hypothetical protein
MYVFLIFGAFSIAVGVLALVFLPDLPSTAKFLSERERAIAVERVAINRQGVKSSQFKWYQVRQAAEDPKTWLLFVMAIGAQVPNSALTSVCLPLIISWMWAKLITKTSLLPSSSALSDLIRLELNIYKFPAVLFSLSLFFWEAISQQSSTVNFIHGLHAWSLLARSVLLDRVFLVGLPDTNKWVGLVALWLCYFQGLGFSMSLTIVSSNIAGYTKKQVTGALLFTGYCVGNIIGPQTFKSSEAPGYKSAYIAYVAIRLYIKL